MSLQPIVLDANILVRAVLGDKVRNLLITFGKSIEFFVPDVCVEDAQKYLPLIFDKRGIQSELPLTVLSKLKPLLQIVDESFYQEYAEEAKERLKNRDLDDWPVVATALTLNSAIWTEDQDFFGSGMPVWTTDRIHLFFNRFKANRND
jgi:predicted nucleic acid-binding protein